MNTKVKHLLFGVMLIFLGLSVLLGAQRLTAHAVSSLPDLEAALVSPSSYEEYLPLRAPTDVAFSAEHIAIADGGTLYVYDRAEGTYTSVALASGRTASKVGFAGERLFVADTGVGNFFYEYDYTSKQLTQLASINCSTFLIEGDTLYTATVSSDTRIGAYTVSQLGITAVARDLGVVHENKTPSMTMLGGTLYCAFGDRVFLPDANSGLFGDNVFYLSDNASLATGVKSVCAYRDELCYTAQGGLYASDLTAHKSRLLLAGEDFGALTSYGDALYAVCGTAVRQISASGDTAAFTGYEITAASSSVNRLSGAVDTARAGDLLVTADAGNGRVSVLNLKTGTYAEALPPENARDFSPRYVATDGNLIAAATEKAVYTCTYAEGETMRLAVAESLGEGIVHGIACVYGSVYYVTGNAYGKAGGAASFHESFGSPAALAADVYGDLYVAYDHLGVVRFTEREFVSDSGGEKLNYTLPAGFTSLRSDFEGNLYCLAAGNVYQNGSLLLSCGTSAQFVYAAADMPLSFALGYEDSTLYLLYGNYLVKTAVEEIPTLDAIDAGGVFGEVFTAHAESGLLCEIPENSIGVRIDLEAMRRDDPENFPYLAYYRTDAPMQGVLVATKDRYALVILYEVETASRAFTATLFRMDDPLEPLPTEEYFRAEQQRAYLSSDVSSYYYPCLHPALAQDALARGTDVEVRGYLKLPERDYALVSYGDRFGYVPAAYLTDVRPLPEDAGAYEPAWLKESAEGVRFTASDGEELLVTERTRVELVENDDGTYLARLLKDGKTYRATVTEGQIDRGESDALRISLIVILFVLAVGIIAVYLFLLPKKSEIADLPEKRS